MALTEIPGGLFIPSPQLGANSGTGILIDATAEKAAFIFRVPKTGTLDKFEFRLQAVTQAPSNGIRCSFQDVSGTTGDPDGTQDQFRDVTSGLTALAWIAPGLMTADGTDTGAKRSVTRGDLLAAVVEFVSWNASDSLSITQWNSSLADVPSGQGYADAFTAAWAKNHSPVMALKYDDGSYGYLPYSIPMSAIASTSFNSGSTPDERALYFSFPVPVSIGGASILYNPVGAGRDADIVLYDSDGTTALETRTLDGDQYPSNALWWVFVPFSQDRDLSANTFYRLAVKPSSADSVQIRELDVSTAAIMDTMHGGQNFHFSSREGGGAWSQTTTKRPFIRLFVTKIDNGAGSGGLVQLVNSGALVG